MIIPRRRFLTLMAAPAIVRASSLMRVRGIVMPMPGSRLYSAFHSALLKGGVAIEWTENGVVVGHGASLKLDWEPSGEITATTTFTHLALRTAALAVNYCERHGLSYRLVRDEGRYHVAIILPTQRPSRSALGAKE